MKDYLRRFLFENLAIRGELVHLDATWQAVLDRHDYPEPLQKLLGELMSAVMLLMAMLKFKGQLIAQVQGSGPVSLLVAEGSSEGTLRAVANWQGDLPQGNMKELLGDGRLVITLEPEQGERYQGIVALVGDTLADALMDYLLRSEQLDTELWLAADAKHAAGLLIQKLPPTSQDNLVTDRDGWNRIRQLSATISHEELLGLGAEEMIHRLYYEEDVRLYAAEIISFQCPCSRDRVANMLRTLGKDEIHHIIDEQKKIEVVCEFCYQKYIFDAVDAEQLLVSTMAYSAPNAAQ